MSLDRHSARILAMQWLCQNDSQPGPVDDTLGVMDRDSNLSEESIDYARQLCERFLKQSDEVDKSIADSLHHWDLGRIDSVHRNILRVATVELIDGEVPVKVILNEAIEIAREFGSADSPAFVNGVLDAVSKKPRNVT